MFFAIAAVVVLIAAAPPALGQKTDPRVLERARSEPAIPVFIVLEHQPQRELLDRAEGANALYRQVAESRYRQAAERAFADQEELRQSREAAEAILLRTRQQAFQAIEQAVGPEQDALEGRLRGLGAARISRYLGINMLTAEIPASAIALLETDPAIARVFAVEKYQAQLATSVPALGAPAFWNAGYTGQGESVGILDSGVRTNHPAFAGKSIVSQVFLTYGSTDPCFADNATSAEDRQGHGTLVSGVVASQGSAGWTSYQGVAKGIGTLYNLKVAYAGSCTGAPLSSDQRDMLAGLDWAVRNTPVKVFNYSYGSQTSSDDDGFSQAVDQYIDTYGLTVAIAAGDGGPAAQTVMSPAIAYNGIAVGNWVSRGAMNPTSAVGPTPGGRSKPDLAAPGTNIFSASYVWDGSPSTADDFVSATGTSLAAPHIAGSAALLRSAGVTDPLAIKAILINTTDSPGWAADSGWGFTNLDRAQEQLYYDTGSLATGDFRFYRVSPSAGFRTTVTWNRHVSGGGTHLNLLSLCGTETYGTFCSFGLGNEGILQSSAAGSDSGVVGLVASFGLGGVSSEPFAIAFSGPWTRLSGPQLGVSCSVPAPVPSGSLFSVTCTVTNSGDMAAWGEAQLTLPAGFPMAVGEELKRDFRDAGPGSAASFTIDTIAASTLPGTYTFGVNVSSDDPFDASASSSFPVTVYSALPPPALVSPGKGARGVSQNPTLTWNASAGATSYDVYLGASSYSPYTGSSVSPTLLASTAGTSYTAGALNPGTLYYWQIVARNSSGASSSATWSFMTQAPQTNQQYVITTVAGRGVLSSNGYAGYGGDGGPAIGAFLTESTSVAVDAAGNLYIADTSNGRVRRVAPNGIITTVAGNGVGDFSGEGGPATSAGIGPPWGLAVDAAGDLYISDVYGGLIRKVAPDGIITTVAGNTSYGLGTCVYSGDGGPALLATLCEPVGIALDAAGNLYIADIGNDDIRKVAPNGIITTVAGHVPWYQLGDGGPAVEANVDFPSDVAADAAGNWYIAQSDDINSTRLKNRVRKVTPGGIITTVAGGSTEGNSGDGGPATSATLDGTTHVAVDAAGSLYIPSGDRIRKVDPSGIINTIAGGGSNDLGDGGLATDAVLYGPHGLAVGLAGQVFFADWYLVRVLLPVDSACQYSLEQSAVAVPAAGGTVPIAIRTGQACWWVVSALPPWLGGNAFGRGPATFNLLAIANPGPLRTATISVAGVAVAVAQGDGPCSYSLSSGSVTIPAGGGAGSIVVTTGPSCPWAASNPVDWATVIDPASGIGSGTVSYSVAPNTGSTRTGALIIAGLPFNVQQLGTPVNGLRFVPVAPCRVADTRYADGPSMAAASSRSFTIPQSGCGIPSTAQAYSLNVTVVPEGPLSYLTLWPTGQDQPLVSTLNSWGGTVVANAAIVPAGFDGAVSVYVTNPTDVILDINGYFDSAVGPSSYSFYPVQPCRVADTRGLAGPFGGPSLAGGQSRDFPVPSSPCGLPSTASAYSMNVTVVPDGYLGYLTTWPTGQAQPNVSTLNSWTGKVVANAALVPSGAGGSVSIYASNPTAVILDANGYFGAPGGTGALNFYPVAPCRVADTRMPDGPLGGPEMADAATRSFPIPSSGCGIPANAAAYSLNVTVVPDGMLQYLTAWPTGSAQPFASTLNSWDGAVVANAAIVPAGAGGAISVYVTNRTHVILDINGYFAP